MVNIICLTINYIISIIINPMPISHYLESVTRGTVWPNLGGTIYWPNVGPAS